MLNLRPYQVEAIRETRHKWHNGLTDVLGVAATGMGKTIIFTALIDLMLKQRPGKRALILSHREELVQQPIEKLLHFFPTWKFEAGVVKGDLNECSRAIISGSVQTLCRPNRMAQLLAHGPINLLVTDEAHHSTAETYQQIYKSLREANPNMRHLGVTATPIRADGEGLVSTFQDVAFRYDIRYGVKNGFLVPLRVLGISTAISLKGVRSTGGDFNQGQLAAVMETDNALDLIVATHKKYAEDRCGIAFTVTVDGAYKLAEKFKEAGIPSAAADGTTPKDVRKKLLADFHSGAISILCNVGLFTEGLDVPRVNVVHMGRPTQSDALYLQMLGRGTRLAPGKEDCLILDYQPKDARRVVFSGDVLGMSREESEVVKREEEEIEEGEAQLGFLFDGDFKGVKGDPLAILHQEIDYLNQSPFKWTKREGWLVLGLGADQHEIERALAITPAAESQVLLMIAKGKRTHWSSAHIDILAEGEFDQLSDTASEIAEAQGSAALVSKSARWRVQPATDGQKSYLVKLAGKKDLPALEALNKGQAAELITFYGARQALRRAGYW